MSVYLSLYDYAIIGGGIAGATAAKILSDNRKNSVLLLGGASSINHQLWIRPTKAVISKWEELLGPLWSPQEVIKRFLEIEKYNGTTDNPKTRGFIGPINIIQAPAEPTHIAKKLVLAIEQATGYEQILDYNNPVTPIGPFTRNQYTQQPEASRKNSAAAFFSSTAVDNEGFGLNGRRLKVLTKTNALNIIFCDKTAIGVKYLKNGNLNEIFVRKKIILSAGMRSPSILIRSGIGPAEYLNYAGINIVKDNFNVGENLANHSILTATFSVNPIDVPVPLDVPYAHLIAGAFLPDPEYGSNPMLRAIQLKLFFSNNMLVIGISPIQPKGSGIFESQSSDPLKILMNTFKIYIKNIATQLYRIDNHYQLLSPTLDIIENDDALRAFIKQNMSLTFQEEGMLKMARNEREGVTNYKGDVFGVKNLIIADNSIIPFVVDANTSASAYLIGYTIANLLLKEDESRIGLL